MSVRFSQLDTTASEFEGGGTDSRSLSLKAGGVTEAKLGFSWEVVEIAASAFSFSSTRSTFTLSTAASSNANVTDFATLLQNGVDNQTLVTTTAAANEFSLSGTTLSVHGDITATGATYKLRYIVGTASGAASAGRNQIWLGTIPQVPLQAESDYFQDGDLDPKWTVLDNDANLTVAEGSDELAITQTSHVGTALAGIFQAAPIEDQFCLTAEIRPEALMESFTSCGVFVAEDIATNPTTGSLVAMAYTTLAGGPTLNFQRFADYNSFTDNVTVQTPFVPYSRFFVRIYVDRTSGGSIIPLASLDGRTWMQVDAPMSFATGSLADVDYIGIHVDNNNTGIDQTARSSMFRVDITADPYLPVGGFVGTSVPSTVQVGPRDIAVSGGNTVNQYGWTDRRLQLIKCEVFSAVVATAGTYTFSLTKDPNGTADNMLSAATFDLTSLSAFVPTSVPLTSTVEDRILNESDVWKVSAVSSSGALDAEGVYFSLTWLVL